jgi:hypothetical protein
MLECRCPKMALHDSFGYLKHKLWRKEGLGVKLRIWLLTTKSQESPWFIFSCMWRVTHCWKAFDEGNNFDFDLTSIKGLHTKLWASKIARVPILIIQFPKWEFIWESGGSFPHTLLHSREYEMWILCFTFGLYLRKPLLWSRTQG